MKKPKTYSLYKLHQAWGAGRAMATSGASGEPLVGKWFHSIKEDGVTIQWQGQVLGALPGERYLVQLYEWFDGAPSNQTIVPFAEMVSWQFYRTDVEMRDFYSEYSRKRNEKWEAERRARAGQP